MVATITSPDELSTQQQELVVAAMENRGRLQVCLRADTHGRAVRGKDKVAFFDSEDREVAGQYIKCLRELERLLLMREDGGRGKYELTNIGWLIGRKLRERS